MIDTFAQLSGDDYWIHTDPERARKQSPFGGTIAHGALVQILQSRMKLNLGYEITGFSNMINYGSDRLRFPAPVPAGSTIHARARVKRVERVKSGMQLTLELNTHVLGSERPLDGVRRLCNEVAQTTNVDHVPAQIGRAHV